MKKLLLFSLMMVISAFSVYSQVTTSSLTGVVNDDKGVTLPGASVTAVHTPSGTRYTTVSNTDGRFSISNMRVGGPYTVEISYIGFQKQAYNDIQLSLGIPYQLNAKLSDSGTTLQEIVVTAGRTSPFNSQKTGAATNVNVQQLSSLPTVTRSLEDFTKLTPQANNNGFAGRDNRYNNVQIDGASFNNGFGLSSDLLPGGTTRPISLDAVEELQVNIAPYDVRQSGFTGAGINAITRSGTNKFTGSAYTYYRNQDLRGTKVGDQGIQNPDNSATTYGVRLGGPIVKNKLFFFANYEHEKETFPGITWIAERAGATGNVARTTAVDLDRVRQHLINTYNYDPGEYENYANKFANESDRFIAKLDWNINDKNKFTVRYTYAKGTSDQVVNGTSGPNPRSATDRVSANSLAFSNSNYSFLNKVSSLTGEWNSTISSKFSNQVLATYSHSQATRSTPGSDFPFVDIWQDGSNYMSFGTELFSSDNDLINDNYSLIDNITYQTGKHTITGGLSYEQMEYQNLYLRMGTSYYRYNSVDDFINNAQPTSFGITYPYAGQDPYVSVRFGLAGLYLQDKFAVNNKFDLTYGIRAELPLYLNNIGTNPAIDNLPLLDQDGNETTYASGDWPKSKIMLSPRVGFHYDAFGDGSLTVRGGTGIFAGRVPFVWLTNMPGATGLIQNNLEPVPASALSGITFNPDPLYWVNNGPQNVFLQNPAGGIPSSIVVVDRDFKMPQLWRSSIGADYEIPGTPLVATADILYSKNIQDVYQFNANRKPATAQMAYSGDNRDFWNGASNATYNTSTGANAVVLSNTTKGHSLATTVGLSVPSRKGFFGAVYYTYTNSKDITGNPGSAAASAWSNNYSINDPNEQLLGQSQYAIPNRVIGNISYRKEYINHLATTVSLFYEGTNPGRFSYTTNGDLNRDGVSLDLLYIPQNAADLNFVSLTTGGTTFTPDQQRAAYEAFVDNSNALKDSKGGYVKRNNGLIPWVNKFDFRLLQDIFTNIGNARNTLQLSVDIQNVGNMLNSDWGLTKQLNTGGIYNYPLLNVSGVTSEGVPSFTMITIRDAEGNTVLPTSPFRDNLNLINTWRMQLGIRYSF